MMDYTHAGRILTEHEDALSRHLMRSPQDERSPLVSMVLDLMASLATIPVLLAEDHEAERDHIMRYAHGAEGDERTRMVRTARWHNHEAVALRKAMA